jgi:hypothetical protein
LSQIACKVSPLLRIDLIRRARLGEIDCGLPRRTPFLPLHGQRFTSPLPDETALELRKGREHVGHRLSGWRRGIDCAVESDERPPFLLRLRHHRCEVEHRTGQAVEFRDNERIRTSLFKLLEGGTNTWALQVLGAETGVFDDFNDLPAPP